MPRMPKPSARHAMTRMMSSSEEALAVQDRAMGFREIAVAGDTLQLAPGLAARMPIRADVAMSKPAVIGASVIRTEMLSSVDGAPAASGEGEHRRRRAQPFGWGHRRLSHMLHTMVDGSAR